MRLRASNCRIPPRPAYSTFRSSRSASFLAFFTPARSVGSSRTRGGAPTAQPGRWIPSWAPRVWDQAPRIRRGWSIAPAAFDQLRQWEHCAPQTHARVRTRPQLRGPPVLHFYHLPLPTATRAQLTSASGLNQMVMVMALCRPNHTLTLCHTKTSM